MGLSAKTSVQTAVIIFLLSGEQLKWTSTGSIFLRSADVKAYFSWQDVGKSSASRMPTVCRPAQGCFLLAGKAASVVKSDWSQTFLRVLRMSAIAEKVSATRSEPLAKVTPKFI